ncbi:hypothetical protein SCALM49S_02819 [Streptomyces californicus]
MASGSDRNPIIIGGLPSQVPDFDPEETQEWLDSLDAAVDERGRETARYLMLRLIERAREKRVAVPEMRSTDYVNTIATKDEPFFPGDEEIERKILNATRWNAAVMVSRAQRPGIGVGGHIATFASSASLYDVGFNHFFRGKDQGDGGDQIFFQGHASPGIYARAYLLDRLSEAQLDAFRQEKSKAPNGLSSYPHPRLMPDFWEFPTVSMGLGPLGAIYQARMNRYMEARGIADTSKSHVWAYLGDGEMDEPESLGQLSIAAREGLDNLTFVVNCNLQRLDGPVRGNGKIIQELESQFRAPAGRSRSCTGSERGAGRGRGCERRRHRSSGSNRNALWPVRADHTEVAVRGEEDLGAVRGGQGDVHRVRQSDALAAVGIGVPFRDRDCRTQVRSDGGDFEPTSGGVALDEARDRKSLVGARPGGDQIVQLGKDQLERRSSG